MRQRVPLLLLALAILSPCPCQSEAIGRLFFTPQERARLDQQRRFPPPSDSSPPGASRLTVDGMVLRHAGRRITWVNGRMMSEDVALPPAAATLRVGETIDLESGEKNDLLQGGHLNLSSAPPLP